MACPSVGAARKGQQRQSAQVGEQSRHGDASPVPIPSLQTRSGAANVGSVPVATRAKRSGRTRPSFAIRNLFKP
jgi:hypothetical protein